MKLLDQSGREFLASVPVELLQRKDYDLVTVDPNQSVESTLAVLSIHKITGAPVFDASKQKIVGNVSVLDLATWIVRTYALSTEKESREFDANQIVSGMDTPIKNVLNWGLEPFLPVTQSTSLMELINNFFTWRVHRVPVVGEDWHATGSVSQSDVLKFLDTNRGRLQSVMGKTLAELKLGQGAVISVVDTEPLIKAFGAIVENQYTGVAVVDVHGRLVSNISASDLRGLTKEKFPKLAMTIKDFLAMDTKKIPPVTCHKEITVAQVVSSLVANRVHRLYVVDETLRPSNVITITTIMRLFSTTDDSSSVTGRKSETELASTSL
jgi:CBS domain-containing protein